MLYVLSLCPLLSLLSSRSLSLSLSLFVSLETCWLFACLFCSLYIFVLCLLCKDFDDVSICPFVSFSLYLSLSLALPLSPSLLLLVLTLYQSVSLSVNQPIPGTGCVYICLHLCLFRACVRGCVCVLLCLPWYLRFFTGDCVFCDGNRCIPRQLRSPVFSNLWPASFATVSCPPVFLPRLSGVFCDGDRCFVPL